MKFKLFSLPSAWRDGYSISSVTRNLLMGGGQNRGSGEWKSPSGVQGQSPGGGLEAKPPAAGDIILNA